MSVASVDESFKELLSRIELNRYRVALASERYNAVKATIEAALPGKTLRQIGSFQRKTKIRPVDLSDRLDIDVVVSFGRFYKYAASLTEGIGPAKALEIVRQALRSNETYKVMPHLQDHPIVRLEYADNMAIELAPAFEDLSGQYSHGPNGPNCYIVGASPYIWQPADYDFDAKTIATLNGLAGDKLVPAIKMVKCYFRNVRVPLKSFHIELLVANTVPALISEWTGKGYNYGYQHILAAFLGQVSNIIKAPASLNGSFSMPVDSGLSVLTLSSVGGFLATKAEAAWRLCATNSTTGWRDFFGQPFPG